MQGGRPCQNPEYRDAYNQLIHSEGEIQIASDNCGKWYFGNRNFVCNHDYLCTNGKNTLYTTKSILPFQQVIEVPGISENGIYRIQWNLEQLVVTMLDSDELILAVLRSGNGVYPDAADLITDVTSVIWI